MDGETLDNLVEEYFLEDKDDSENWINYVTDDKMDFLQNDYDTVMEMADRYIETLPDCIQILIC